MDNSTPKPSIVKPPKIVKVDWLIPGFLIFLSLVPLAAGISRLVMLGGTAGVTAENARFFAAPLPVVMHILTACTYCILGALQFSAKLRGAKPSWHRRAGRLLVPLGFIAALSGLWMTQFYPLNTDIQGNLLYGVRILVGAAMMIALMLGVLAILRRDISHHRAWMMRSYALGQGAGTQVFIFLPWFIVIGEPTGICRDILMTLGWLINIVVAEWVIHRRL